MSKKKQFNIIRNDSTTHGGYHTGTLSLNNLSAILLHGDEAKIDLGLIHAKSAVERGIRFTSQREELTNGELYWVVWVTIDRKEAGTFYAGIAVCPMVVDKEARRGWKNLAEHVNRMDDALKRRIKLDELDEVGKRTLQQFLQAHDAEMWQRSEPAFQAAFV
jgi:hypothetical protein